jgi:sterol desaturase/sphingolipid hydroxylase (fatty acid hydroxylase superfamily)
MEGLHHSPLWLAVVAASVLAELGWRQWTGRGYDGTTALTTLGLVVGNIPAAALNVVIIGGAYALIWRFAPLRWPLHDWKTWAAGFLLVEFAYYWVHRASHRVAWMWASHSVHHSAEQLTLLSSFRLGWTNALSGGWLFYLPLVFIGFDPRLVLGLLVFDLHYQFFLHTEAVGRLGPLEYIFNTPAHHRVHHAANEPYLDRNYGGMLIIFDRLFGTLAIQRPDEPLRYGLAHRAASRNPIRIAFGEWWRLIRSMRATKGIRARLDLALAAPGDE